MTPDQYLTAFKLTPLNTALALSAGASLYAAGRHEEALAVWTLGADFDPAVRKLHLDPAADPAARDRSLKADTAIRAHFSELHRKTVDAVADELDGADLTRVRNGVWVQFADQPIKYRHPHQQPSVFYVPDLPPVPVAPPSSLPWVGGLEAAFPDIRAEFDAAMQSPQLTPYIPENTIDEKWQTLAGTLDWASLYLFDNARPTEALGRFPKTMAALNLVGLSEKNGAPIELFFSILKPGTHIPPHYGQANSRLTAHLPIHVPENCGIRIDSDTLSWTEGKVMAFDDSFEHEAWNRSDSPRAVLIFEIPHPDLTPEENIAIRRIYETFDSWIDSRQSILGL